MPDNSVETKVEVTVNKSMKAPKIQQTDAIIHIYLYTYNQFEHNTRTVIKGIRKSVFWSTKM